MKVFVTGATGFIGGHLVQRLAKTDHKTVCLVRDPDRADKIKASGATLVKGDVTNKKSVLEGMKGCDWVFNLANMYTLWLPDKRAYHEINVEGTRNVIEAALENGISRVVHVSTYAMVNEQPPVVAPQGTEYARTKYAGDLVAWGLHKKNGLPLVVIYPGGVLGKGDNKLQGLNARVGLGWLLAFPHLLFGFDQLSEHPIDWGWNSQFFTEPGDGPVHRIDLCPLAP